MDAFQKRTTFYFLIFLFFSLMKIARSGDFYDFNSEITPSILQNQQNGFMEFFPYEDNYTHDGIFVHEFISYAFHPTWQFAWERQFFKKSGLRMSSGSLRTDELLVHGELTLNEDLSRGWWFNSRGIWYSNLHRNHRDLNIYLGLEREINKSVSLFVLCFPRFTKEDLGVQLGISWFGEQRQHYLNLALVLPEMVWDEKNDLGGTSDKKPLGLQWYGRYGWERFTFFSEGYYSLGFERVFADSGKSPLITSHSQRINQAQFKIYYQPKTTSMLQFHFYTYLFKEAKSFYQEQNDFDYKNLTSNISLRYLFVIKEKHQLQLLSHYVIKDGRSLGFRQHDFERRDLLAGLFYEYFWSDNTIELGYMLSLYDWTYNSADDALHANLQNKYYDKVYLGYTYSFDDRSTLRISISHQPAIKGFGGGSIQYMMFF